MCVIFIRAALHWLCVSGALLRVRVQYEGPALVWCRNVCAANACALFFSLSKKLPSRRLTQLSAGCTHTVVTLELNFPAEHTFSIVSCSFLFNFKSQCQKVHANVPRLKNKRFLSSAKSWSRSTSCLPLHRQICSWPFILRFLCFWPVRT